MSCGGKLFLFRNAMIELISVKMSDYSMPVLASIGVGIV
jgi:hypothetical protein